MQTVVLFVACRLSLVACRLAIWLFDYFCVSRLAAYLTIRVHYGSNARQHARLYEYSPKYACLLIRLYVSASVPRLLAYTPASRLLAYTSVRTPVSNTSLAGLLGHTPLRAPLSNTSRLLAYTRLCTLFSLTCTHMVLYAMMKVCFNTSFIIHLLYVVYISEYLRGSCRLARFRRLSR